MIKTRLPEKFNPRVPFTEEGLLFTGDKRIRLDSGEILILKFRDGFLNDEGNDPALQSDMDAHYERFKDGVPHAPRGYAAKSTNYDEEQEFWEEGQFLGKK